jgi:hypothetical protein
MFWITVGQASRQTAAAIGPSTMERSNFREAAEEAGGWMRDFTLFPHPGARRPQGRRQRGDVAQRLEICAHR